MEVEFRTNKLKKQCENPAIAQKEYGAKMGFKLTQRVVELSAAISLQDIKCIPSARLHRLDGDRNTQYAVDLVHPYRLVFQPILSSDTEIFELDKIKVIRIEEVVDYHGKNNRK